MNEEDRIIWASAQPKAELLGCFQRAAELDATGLGNAELFERAERYLRGNHESIDFRALARLKPPSYDGPLPSSFKVRINDPELDTDINEILRSGFHISRIITAFKMRIVMLAYVHWLEGNGSAVPAPASPGEAENLHTLRLRAISLILSASSDTLTNIIEELEVAERHV